MKFCSYKKGLNYFVTVNSNSFKNSIKCNKNTENFLLFSMYVNNKENGDKLWRGNKIE